MNKPDRNIDGKYIPIDVAMKKYNMCRNTLMKVSDDARATIRLGRIVRINTEKFEEYLDSYS